MNQLFEAIVLLRVLKPLERLQFHISAALISHSDARCRRKLAGHEQTLTACTNAETQFIGTNMCLSFDSQAKSLPKEGTLMPIRYFRFGGKSFQFHYRPLCNTPLNTIYPRRTVPCAAPPVGRSVDRSIEAALRATIVVAAQRRRQ